MKNEKKNIIDFDYFLDLKTLYLIEKRSGCNEVEGQKTVCLDKLYEDIRRGECLVYSFGIGDEFSFELAMANMGCQVRAFDQYTETKDEKFSKHPNITFSLVGLSFVSGLIEIGKPFS
jgi:hypothetical protein